MTVDFGIKIDNGYKPVVKAGNEVKLFYEKGGCAFCAEVDISAKVVTEKGRYAYCKQVVPFGNGEIKITNYGLQIEYQ